MAGVIQRAGRLGAALLLLSLASGVRAEDPPPAPAPAPASAPTTAPMCPFEIPATAPPFTLDGSVRDLKEGEPLRILAIGSSSTAGFGASSPARAYPAQLAARLSTALAPRPVEVVNGGISGESAPATLARLKAALAGPSPPQIVIWQVGTNDILFGGTPEGLRQRVEDGLAAIAEAKAVAIVIDQQYFPAIMDLKRYETFVAAVDGPAAARKVALLPRYQLMKEWAVANPKAYGAILAFDRFHMGDRGYACLADLLAAGILAPPAAAEPAAAPAR